MEKNLKDLLEFSFIIIDKPTGPTSFGITKYLMNELKLRKTSHMGTLDPMVTGVLPIALNRACKLSEFMMHRNKVYVGIMRLHEDVEEEKLNKAIDKHMGKIVQLPPVRSAVKRAERIREVVKFKILEREGKDILFETEVQAGTYIRKLIHDIGLEIGGAHMLELRRTKAGIFTEKEMVNLYDFDSAVSSLPDEKKLRKMLIPAEEAIREAMPVLEVKEGLVKSLLTGKPLMKKDAKKMDENFAVFCGERFICVMRPCDEGDIIARPLFVFN